MAAGCAQDHMVDNATTRYLQCVELITITASFVEWVALPSLAAVSVPFRAICQAEATHRVKIGLDPILRALELDFDVFMSALGDDNAFIGSTALRVMYTGSTFESLYQRLPRLTVVVPFGKRPAFISALNKPTWTWIEQPIGYQSRATIRSVTEVNLKLQADFRNDDDVVDLVPEPEPDEADNEYCAKSRAHRRERLKRTVSTKFVSWMLANRGQIYLRVIESSGHVLQVLAGSDSTRDMLAITSTRIYLPWAKLFHANLALTGPMGWDRGHNKKAVPEIHMNNSMWPFPCGKLCPIIPRKGRAGDGTGVFFWNGEKEREYTRRAKEWEEQCGWGGWMACPRRPGAGRCMVKPRGDGTVRKRGPLRSKCIQIRAETQVRKP